ncbi:MAG: UDP-N-acetylmuramoyl-tripeptide--D-alanyl-D-alanine ligase [Patescibacteria group bacterium]
MKRAKPQIIAVTGSVGKTSTKEAIFSVLKIKFGNQIRKSEGNLNNETGVPLAILGFQKSPEIFWHWLPIIVLAKIKAIFAPKVKVLVLELAADKPGDIGYLTSFVKPNVAVITSIGPAHLEAFGTIEEIVKEKSSLLLALSEDGTAILNIDDIKLKEIVEKHPGQIKTYAIFQNADCFAKNITTEILNFRPLTKFQVVENSHKFPVEVPSLGRVWNVYAALVAISCGIIFKLNPQEIREGLKTLPTSSHRLQVFEGKKASTIIDDSYNANPVSMTAALDILKLLPAQRKIAVLGDMREIGNITDESHKIIGQYAREVADEVIALGQLAKKYQAHQYFDKKSQAIDYLLSKIGNGDIILVKASRALELEKIVEAIKK